jgi:hypothetical protein
MFANLVSIFIQNSPFDQAEFYGRTETIALPAPTECGLQIANAAYSRQAATNTILSRPSRRDGRARAPLMAGE